MTEQLLPVIALVGRSNVGKSTLFNRLTRSRDAIVANAMGITRDRHYALGKLGSKAYWVVDSGGFEPQKKQGVSAAMSKQTKQAIAEAHLILFVVDARSGLHYLDKEIYDYIRVQQLPCILVANKAEGWQPERALADFYELAIKHHVAISANHGDGVSALMELAFSLLHPIQLPALQEQSTVREEVIPVLKLAVVGRPNVGKSTLINTLIGEERLVTFDDPGTTRDTIEIHWSWQGKPITLIDTAGVRKRSRISEVVEKISVIKTIQAIEYSNVCILLLDGTQDVSDQDAYLAGLVIARGRALVIAINKWDSLDRYRREQVMLALQRTLRFCTFAESVTISAIKRHGLKPLMQAVLHAHQSAFVQLSTPKLTRALALAVQNQQPARANAVRPKLRYAHQGGQNPPLIIIHGSHIEKLTTNYQRYLEKHFREFFSITATPLRIQFKQTETKVKTT